MYCLKPIGDSDHEFLVALHNDPEVLKNLTHPEPINLSQHLAWWEEIGKNQKQQRHLFTIDGINAGLTKFYDIDHINNNCVLGADLHADFRGKGHSKHMWKLMLNHCFKTLNLHRVSLTTARYNWIARRLYVGLGFREEGVLSQSLFRNSVYHDQICMFMLKSDWRS
jgi:diamine N-acetyltransferase